MSNTFETKWGSQITGTLQANLDNLTLCKPSNLKDCASIGGNILVDFSGATAKDLHSSLLKKDDKCSSHTPILEKIKINANALILLNVQDPKILSNILGFGVSGQCVIIRPIGDAYAVDVLGAEHDGLTACCISEVTHQPDGGYCFSPTEANKACCSDGLTEHFQSLCVPDQTSMIANILACDFEAPSRPEPCCALSAAANIPSSLPKNQVFMLYLTIDKKWNLDTQQVANDSVVFEISLIASFSPAYKYLRIRTLGAGFNPTNGTALQPNTKYEKGYIQTLINLHLEPQSDKLRVLSTDPKNINGTNTYTAGSSFSVGVDISKNPGFSPSYTVSESETRTISDFNIYNNSAGIVADWDFSMSMIEDSVWDAFSKPFLKKGQIKDMPPLATKNLQPVTDTVWYCAGSVKDNIGVLLSWKVNHHKFWVTGNWANYTMHSRRTEMRVGYFNTPFHIDFGSVNA